MNLKKLIALLQLAKKEYYETGEPIMSDQKYDELVEELRQQCPDHIFFNTVGPTPSRGKEALPIPMPSLKKIKPDSCADWVGARGANGWVVSEKLDGISALWCTGTKKLFLRGDGLIGQNVSFAVPYIQGLVTKNLHWIIRGELIAPTATVQGTLARNWVNGILHQDSPNQEDLRKIQFIAYQVIEPASLTRSQQFSWLSNQGFLSAWSKTYKSLTPALLSAEFQQRRSESKYTCDGIVIGTDTVPVISASDPNDACAYKEVSDDQCAVTKVIEVEWLPSRTGNWIPRLRLEPVLVGSASIQFCTAFNAKYIRDTSLGPGAVVKIRRSGDVIPVVDSIVQSSPRVEMPPDGQWKWDATETHAVVLNPEKNLTVIAKGLVHSCSAFGIEGFREASAIKLCDANILSVAGCIRSPQTLQNSIGKVLGERLHTNLVKFIKEATLEKWIYAFHAWPKGFGERKLDCILAIEKDCTKWSSLEPPAGLSATSLNEVVNCIPKYISWRNELCTLLRIAPVAPVAAVAIAVTPKGEICLSGFRDADLKLQLESKGYIVSDTMTKKTTALFVADKNKPTTKSVAAKKANIPIYERNDIHAFLQIK